MSSVTRVPELALDPRRWLDRLLAIEFSLDGELLAFLALTGLAFVLHFWDLGSRALHHDESLHAVYSWYLYKGQGYHHDPLMHGPVLFHLTALMYLLFGVTNATARFSAAFAGTALVFTPYFFRRWLGRWGAIAASALLVFSPTVLYYSRFLREDIFVALWTAGLFIGVWRYLQSRQHRWLYLTAGCLALGFANKEITYMLAGIVLIYTDVLLAGSLSIPLAEHHLGRRPSWTERTVAFLALLPVAWAVAVLWHPLRSRRERFGLGDLELPASGDLLVVVGTLTLPQLAALITIPFKHFGHTLPGASYVGGAPITQSQLMGGVAETVIVLIGASVLAGIVWNQRRWLICAAIFYGIYICLYTTFFTNLDGFTSGIWGSLNYWLAQQGVKRGAQPVYYYAMILPAYEYVALAFGFIAVAYQALRRGWGSVLMGAAALALLPLVAVAYGISNVLAAPLAVAAIALGVAAVRGDALRQMLLFWFGGLFFALSLAGEKMPWLNLHLALPLILLAGLGINDLIAGAVGSRQRAVGDEVRGDRDEEIESTPASSDPPPLPSPAPSPLPFEGRGRGLGPSPLPFEGRGRGLGQRGRWALLAGAAVLGAAVVIPLAWGPGSDGVHAALFVLALAVVVAIGVVAGVVWSSGFGAALAGAMLLGLLLPVSVRTAWDLSYIHGDTPYEALVYTQTSPDLPKIMQDIDQYARQSGSGYNTPIIVDANDAFTWPWAWYLRDYHDVSYIDLSSYLQGQASTFRPQPNSIMLVHDADLTLMQQYPGQFGAGIPYHHRWWFPEDYRGTTVTSFASSLTRGSTWSFWWGFLAAQHGIVKPEAAPGPGIHPIGTENATAFFPATYKPGVGIMLSAAQAPAPKADANGGLTVGAPGSAPGDFLRPAGVAVDSQGNFYVADSQNNRVEKFDSTGRLLASSDGSAPGQAGFHEPWGVAVDKQGMVYVADTWNHRIVKLDAQLKLITTWGHPNPQTGPDGLLSFYGPRAIAFESNGNLLVTDTGNERVIEFSPSGQPLGSFGSAGNGGGQFQEPVGIAVAADGTIYVADTWNGRIDVFNSGKHWLRSLPVKGWESHSIENKPYLTVLANGDLLLSQPDSDRLLELSPSGATVKSTSSLGAGLALTRPIGVATDSAGNLYVADGGADQVTRLPLSTLP
jgi:predicted membrane-bound mannosyltransferase/DNA-binding beta-propeller fold protein YncE